MLLNVEEIGATPTDTRFVFLRARPTPGGGLSIAVVQECDGCLHFVAPSSCKMVDGKINPKGWCALFAPKPKPK